jgi:hypothetical protein
MFMKALKAVCIALVVFLVGCGGGNNSAVTPSGATSLEGSWTITATNGANAVTLNVTLVSSSCSVTQSGITFTVTGPACAVADNPGGQGSISGTGNFIYPPQGVLLGASADPVPSGSQFNLLFVEADNLGDIAVFSGSGTINSGSITGTFTCDLQTPVCTGDSGTFNGKHN